jgi:DNA-binding response OmpR family regulator
MKVLVVDDAAEVIEAVTVSFTLQWRETEVIGADNGESALDLVEQEHPDVVLLDIAMPGMSGFEVLREIRAFSDVPVIMLTARDDVLDKVKGLELGADDYVTKPFDHLELLARVKALLRRLDMPRTVVPQRGPDRRLHGAGGASARGGRATHRDGVQAALPPRPQRRPRAATRDAAGEGLGSRVRRRGRLPPGLHPALAPQARTGSGTAPAHPHGTRSRLPFSR